MTGLRAVSGFGARAVTFTISGLPDLESLRPGASQLARGLVPLLLFHGILPELLLLLPFLDLLHLLWVRLLQLLPVFPYPL